MKFKEILLASGRAIAKAGASNFNPSGGGRSNFSQALIPGKRLLGIGEILAPGGSQNIRDIASEYWFGPLQPVSPTAPSTYRPRQYAYSPGSNIIWQPKGDSPINFDTLRALADSWDLLRLVIETQKDRICRTKLVARLKMQGDEKSRAEWEKRNNTDKTVQQLNNEFLASPDGFHDFKTWLRMWLEDMIVCDATALWLERDLKGRIASVHPIAGDTINRLLTDQGITPPPPSPAYQQVVYGTPACDLTTDDLIYYMRNERTNRRYGFSPVEQILITISIGLRRQEFQLQYYTSGNVPEALCFLPGDIPADKVKEYQDFFDAMLAGDLSKRRRLTFLPGFGTSGQAQSSVQFTKDVLLKDEMDEWLARIACFCIGVNPQPFMKQLAPRAGAEVQQQTSEEEGKEPFVSSVVDILNALLQRKMGLANYEIVREEEIELDILKQAQADNLVVGKIIKVNEVRKRRGLDPDDSPEADQLGMFTPTGFVPLSADDQLQRQQTLGVDPDTNHARAMEAAAAQPEPSAADDDKPPKGKPNGKPKGNGAAKAARARFSHGSLRHIQAGVLTHTSQEAKTSMEQTLVRVFHRMRNTTVQHLHAAVNKTVSMGSLAKLDVANVEEFKQATLGKTRYSVNHVFSKPLQLRPRGKKPYGKVSQIKEVTLKLKDLIPTQYWVKPAQVLHYVDEPTSKPVHVVKLQGQLLLSDGHHRAVAATLRGETTIAAKVFPRWASEEEIARHKAKKLAGYAEGELAKADGYDDIVDQLMDNLQGDFSSIPNNVQPYLEQAALSGLTQGVLSIDVSDTDLLSDVNTTAKDWAADRAAELVGMRWSDADGELLANPNAKWAISQTTRDKIQGVVEQAFSEATNIQDVAAAVDASGIFSAARAETIARTEISRAQVLGNFELWLKSGLVTEVDWLLSQDDPCDECQEFADGSPYPIDEAPLPVDDSHPNCRCILSAAALSDEEAE